jgi:hypothetical protein
MRTAIIAILLVLSTQHGFSQTFLATYQEYQLRRLDSTSNSKTRSNLKAFVKSQITELDTVFRSYKRKNGFDFNTSDSLFLIYDSPAESPFTSNIIIWSGKDTISYKQGFETVKPVGNKRIITYKPFIQRSEKLNGLTVVTERDSLMTLVSKRDFKTINHLGDNQEINDGGYIRICVAYKVEGKYKLEFCNPRQFVIVEAYRRE